MAAWFVAIGGMLATYLALDYLYNAALEPLDGVRRAGGDDGGSEPDDDRGYRADRPQSGSAPGGGEDGDEHDRGHDQARTVSERLISSALEGD